MDFFFAQLQNKINVYQNRYGKKYYLVIFKLIFFLFKCLLSTKYKKKLGGVTIVTDDIENKDCLTIGCVLGGGIGDILVSYLYIVKFAEKLDCRYKFHLFVGQSLETIKSLLNNSQLVSSISSMSCLEKNNNIDLLIRIEVQFPIFTFINEHKIRRLSNFILNYKNELEKFQNDHWNIIGKCDRTFYQQAFCQIKNMNRVTAMDVSGLLGLNIEDQLQLDIPEVGNEILKHYNLTERKYITLNRSCDINNPDPESIKLWPVQNFSQLVTILKSNYPDFTIVQLGYSHERCKTIPNVDINLIGKTNFSEVMALIKNSFLHIDGEGGLVHLRHFLCARPSVVLFGPTSPQNRGYPENINIRNTDCQCQFCEWIVGENWQSYCIKSGTSAPLCMQSISPSLVIRKIEESRVMFYNKV